MYCFGVVFIGIFCVFCWEIFNSWKELFFNRNEIFLMEIRFWGSCKICWEKWSFFWDSLCEKWDFLGIEMGFFLESGGGWVLRIEIDFLIKEMWFIVYWWCIYDLIFVVYWYGVWFRSCNRYLIVFKSV